MDGRAEGWRRQQEAPFGTSYPMCWKFNVELSYSKIVMSILNRLDRPIYLFKRYTSAYTYMQITTISRLQSN